MQDDPLAKDRWDRMTPRARLAAVVAHILPEEERKAVASLFRVEQAVLLEAAGLEAAKRFLHFVHQPRYLIDLVRWVHPQPDRAGQILIHRAFEWMENNPSLADELPELPVSIVIRAVQGYHAMMFRLMDNP